MKVKSESEVIQSCPTLSDPMDFSLPGSSVHGIFQVRVLECTNIPFSSHPCQYLLFVDFLRVTIQIDMRWYLIAILICISLTMSACLENPRDGGAWGAAVSGVTQSRTRLK